VNPLELYCHLPVKDENRGECGYSVGTLQNMWVIQEQEEMIYCLVVWVNAFLFSFFQSWIPTKWHIIMVTCSI